MANAVKVGDDQDAACPCVLAERHRQYLGQHPGILRRAGFEELGHAGQTAGDVACLLRFLRNPRENLAHLNLAAHRAP